MDKKTIQTAFGENVKRYRSMIGKSQEDFAFLADMSTVYLGELERGEKCPSIEMAYKISMALGINIAQLLDFDTAIHIESEVLIRVKDVLKGVPDHHKIRLVGIFEKFCTLYKDDFKL